MSRPEMEQIAALSGMVPEQRLSSWKEIAAHFRVSVRTVQRWEAEEGLPVSRHPHSRLASVFAYRPQLEQWWTSRSANGVVSTDDRSHHTPAVEARRIAVLPFVDLNRDLEMEILADGLTEDLITTLSQVPGLRVIARASAFVFKNERIDVRTVGQRLGAELILEGSVQRSGDRLRICAQLVRAADGCQQWARQFDGPIRDFLDLQEEIAQRIVDALRLILLGGIEAQSPAPRHRNPEAYRIYLKGQHFFHGRRPQGLQTALACFQQALAMDPDFAAAWARLADCHVRMANFALAPTEDAVLRGRAAARRALELDPTQPEPHVSLAFLAAAFDYDWVSAEEEFRAAIQLRPRQTESHGLYAAILICQGRFAEAEIELEAVSGADPLNALVRNTEGFMALCRRQFDLAAASFTEALRVEPTNPYTLYWLAEMHLLRQRFADASAIAAEIGIPAFGAGIKAYVYSQTGRGAEALALRAELEAMQPCPAVQTALACLGMGDRDGTYHWLDRAADLRSLGIVWIKVDPLWDSVRADPKFRALLERIHLTDR